VTELLQVTGHPAPWPHRDLDVAAMRARGHEPVPFCQFILKVHSRCNLSCTYCYVYEMADRGWPGLPRRMDTAIAGKVADRIGEHAQAHDLPGVDVILHGGEPLLAGTEWLTELAGTLRARVPAQVNIGVQTNGTLLRPRMLQALKQLGVGIGVSLDGDAEATGRHRLYPSGRNSFDDVADGLRLLGSPGFREIYSGILCTIDVQNDPLATYEALLEFRPPAVDLLLPHANWSCLPPAAGYPILLADLIAQLEGTAYVGRCAVNNAANVARTKRHLTRAFEAQVKGAGFSFVEILTMCPTGWFIDTPDAPSYLASNLAAVHTPGVVKDVIAERSGG
jgi:uncharacterized Fe-S cluster-containing radical SAM superfamily protein